MAIKLSDQQPVKAIDAVTTPAQILKTYPIGRSQLRWGMLRDKFEWIQIDRTIIIDRETFLNWWASENPRGIDTFLIMK